MKNKDLIFSAICVTIVLVMIVFTYPKNERNNTHYKDAVFANDSMIVVNTVLISINNYARDRELKIQRGETPMSIDEVVASSKQEAHEMLLQYGHK